ncbi:4'-phosphopantetheinyl transferase superfamily protein [Shimazuella sp. AN120528]|uniref:4'-phosphopantetheinyl transferase family protein n=1 Tax=Shimazuella soli TaxID=1892854 RepID=UPI001F0CFF1B|nr:4'-phosphopantetheinyl transferase superfamily protein [Shimazuella soli]MCH5586174.1 4'-phosphopantetheinyl transferase superfamily protein [Shimazuella soli]
MRNLPCPTQVDLYLFSIDPNDYDEKEFLSILSAEEQEKANKFHFPSLQKKYVISHGMMRQLIASYIACNPRDIRYHFNAFGKPELVIPSCPLHFNLSHSEQFAALAIASHPVGADIEQIKPLEDYVSLTRHFLSIKERKSFCQLAADDQQLAFYRAWTRKEAYIKAIGMGLSYPVEQVTISFDEQPQLLEDRANPMNVEKLSIVSFEHKDYLGAVAIPKDYTVEIKKISLQS